MISIHCVVVRRLVLAWLVVSLLVGGLTYYLELEQIDDAVVALASSQSSQFAPEGLKTSQHSAEELRILQQRASEFVKRNFIVIEVYDNQEQRILEAVNPQYAHIEAELKRLKNSFPHDAHSHFQNFLIGGDTVVQVQVPLPGTNGGNTGFFEGVFVVDSATLREFHDHTWRMLASVLLAVLAASLLLYPVITTLNRNVIRFSQELLMGNLEIASVLGAAIAKRDSDTGEHNYRVTLYAIELAEAVGLAPGEMRQLILGAFLHDVGKIGISDNILLKPGKLTDEEFAIMRTHVALGVDIIDQSDWLRGARDVIESHHEKFDGSGYLRGLSGTNIPLNARIFSIVDVFDALTSRRPYKAPMPLDVALGIIQKDAGTHFDPSLVRHFLAIAAGLHVRIGVASEAELQARLREQGQRYFMHASIEVNSQATAPSHSRRPKADHVEKGISAQN